MTGAARPARADAGTTLAAAQALVRRVPWYPTVFGVALILAFHMASATHLLASLRAMVLAGVTVAALQLLVTGLLRDRHVAALVATIALVTVFGWEAVRLVVVVPEVRWYLLLFVPSILLLVAATVRRRRHPGTASFDAQRASGVLARLPIPVVLAVLLFGFSTGALAQDLRDLGVPGLAAAPVARSATAPAGAPDLWMVMLDGHPRRDSAMRILGYDEGPFLDALAAQGLEVAERSRSNYTTTELTLPSLFLMRQLDDAEALRPLSSGSADRVEPTLRAALNDNPVFGLLHERGYEIVTSAPPYEDVTLRSADRYLDGGEINEFELNVMRSTLLLEAADVLAPDLLSAQHRQRLLGAFRHIDEEASRRVPYPRFIFVHVVGPHMPAVFDADGTPIRAPNSFNWYSDTAADRGLTLEEFGRLYTGQLRYIDALAETAVQRIVEADPNAVVIVFSDHGSRSRFHVGVPALSDLDEATANLFAARTPGHAHLFPATITPVNIFPRLLDAYFGLDLALSPDTSYTPKDGGLFPLEVVPLPATSSGS